MRNKQFRFKLMAMAAAGVALGAPGLANAGMVVNNMVTVNTAVDSVDASPGDGLCEDANGRCSLRAAVMEANALPGANTIELRPQLYRLRLAGKGEDAAATGDLDVTDTLTIIGNGSVIDGANVDRIFDNIGANLTLSYVNMSRGAPASTESGGAIQSTGTLNIDHSQIGASTVTGASASGGAIFNNGGTANISFSTLSGNTAVRAGGAIEANAGSTTLNVVTMDSNFAGPAPGNGGAFHLTGAGTVNVTGTTASNNVASSEGGGLWNSSTGTMLIRSSNISANQANGDAADNGGGGLFNDGGTMTVQNTVISDNTALGTSGSGGGILSLGDLSVTMGTISGNSASRAGGGIEANNADTTLRSLTLSGNSTGAAPGNGGGMHITGAGNADIFMTTVTGNTAASEGGGLWNSTGEMKVMASTVIGNTANGAESTNGGGGLFNNGGTMTVTRSTIGANFAPGASGSGGGIFNDQGTLAVRISTISGNSASRAGGGVEANAGDTTLSDTSLLGNQTGPSPGNGGGLHLTGAGNVLIARGGVYDNTATNEGGGLWNSSTGTMTVVRTGIARNTAPVGPDAFTQPGGVFRLNGTLVQPVAAGGF